MKRVVNSSISKINIGSIIPVLSILGAGAVLVLNWIGILVLSIPESIIIGLIALLAIDALTERITILKRIEDKVSKQNENQILKPRTEIEKTSLFAKDALELYVVATHAGNLLSTYLGFLEKRIKEGLIFKLVILNHESDALKVWNKTSKYSDNEVRVKSAISMMKELAKSSEDNCQLRLNNLIVPFSVVYVKLSNDEKMIVEFNAYKTAVDSKPHIVLSRKDNEYWFNFYYKQIQQIWNDCGANIVELV